jgi:ribosomal protein S12 methylthiotransferase accessory factor
MATAPASKLHLLLQKHGGLFSAAPVASFTGDEPRIFARSVDLGDVGAIWPEVGKRGNVVIRAAGSGLDEESALIPALAEGLERYSLCVFRSEQFTWATANELGQEALDLDTLPRCSASELAHPKCPLVLPDKSKRIRWVRGLSLFNGRLVWVPAVLAYSHAGYAVPDEKFWLPISTGCAAHASYERALLAGLYEVVERDAISLVWLQQLALPRIEIDCFPPPFAACWERCSKGLGDLEYRFFDATTDLGVPTVYGLQISPHSARVRSLVSCATGITMAEALAKVTRDMVAFRRAFRKEWPVPQSWDDFTELLHGATLMARASSASAFEFLLHADRSKRLSQIQGTHSPDAALQAVINRLLEKQLDVFVVDLTTDEAIRAGMRVLRVIVPGLQPLSFRYRARFLGHSRLYSAPAAMGYAALPEEKLNAWPQPFA